MSAPDVQSLLEESAKARGVPGCSLAVFSNGELRKYVAGVLNADTGETVQPESMFQIGSITKVWTATLMMQLVDQGRVDLDLPVREYLPDFRTADAETAKTVTVRRLLNHTSGLDGDFFTDTGVGSDKLARFVDRCALLPQLFPIGQGFSYSNSAFNIAGRVIEVAGGRAFEDALRERLIKPLGLRNAASEPHEIVGRSVSAGHVPDPDDPDSAKKLDTIYTLAFSGSPAGSTLMTSAADLVTFARMHLNGGVSEEGQRILSRSSVEDMQSVHVAVPVPTRDIDAWGLGWFFSDPNGLKIFGHDGGTIGQSAYLRIHKETNTVAVLFANGGRSNDLMMDVFAEVFDPVAGFAPTPPPKPVKEEPEDLSTYVGTYRNIGGDFVLELADGTLTRTQFFQLDDAVVDQPKAELAYAGDETFIWGLPGQGYPSALTVLAADEDGRASQLFSGLRVYNRVT